REKALLWKMYAIPLAKYAIFQQDPLAALVDAWAFCIQMKQYFTMFAHNIPPIHGYSNVK
ncbi:MAG: hypothetical protein ACTSSP_07835, partial [Candidatus Asgardarchaeia archaeon]